MDIKLYNSDLASPSLIADLTTRAEKTVFSTRLPGGFHLCNFNLRCSLVEAWDWITNRQFYRLLISDVTNTLWEGRINSLGIVPSRDQGTILKVGVVGYYANLGDIPYSTAYNAHASVVIKAVLTANCSQISSDQTHIDATDITINSTSGNDYLDIYPQALFDKLLNFSDSTNGIWYFAVWDNRVPYLFKKDGTTVKWYISLQDFVTLELTHRAETLWNSAYAVYESGGAVARTTVTNDTNSQTKYGVTRQYVVPDLGAVAVGNAQSYRDMILANYAQVYPRSTNMVLGNYVKDANGIRVPSYYVRAGDVIRITDLVPTSLNLDSNTLDSLRNFYLVETDYDIDSHQLTIVPDTDNMKLDAILARKLGI